MKSILYISAILLVLSGCKGNAFLKQRYTHFSNASVKKESRVLNSQKQTPTTLAFSDEPEERLAVPVFYNSENEVSEKAQLMIANKRINTGAFKSISSGQQKISSDKRGITKYTKQVKNHFKQVNDSKRGIIGTLLKIILSIIILAIVVGVVIIVLTLA